MKGPGCQPVSCNGNAAMLGGVAASDFAALDELAVKLICLDSGFAAPLREAGRVLGERVAAEQAQGLSTLDVALSALIAACGLDSKIRSRLLHTDADEALFQVTGCIEALGGPIPNVGRAVCGFDAGLIEGFLRGAIGEQTLSVEETACLGLGHPSCEFVIRRNQAPGGATGKAA